ncbi:AGE family epimerase/isomerase [Mucilaginibacter sp. UR6-1]|uniref:AGE family epimerase/isomerase n=1 Tax=Mucilaginibacter sp. UR6-1 TaxID=1435643 RepID=UPI001E360312|nr:AGE family epimerase/isomerase [Mucilaginibacter sp. UR6-1]MCC8407544.1 AGE family epimerase/isomerase [Mucilaginibacter sp. UR6-1]
MEKTDQLLQYGKQVRAELSNILNFWSHHSVDHINGGFLGRVDHHNHPYPDAPKGSVMHARILWAYSAAYNFQRHDAYLELARRAYQYILGFFVDEQHGGIYWTADHLGNPLDTKKQVYANAFVIYALAEYYKATNDDDVKQQAIDLYNLLVEKSYDHEYTGYFEAYTHDWQPIADLRLSAKDANEQKSMNTHLHVLEAYVNLYTIWPDAGLKQQIISLLKNFSDHIIDNETGHLVLFFDEYWNRRSNIVSYGHDIEAAWLLLEAAEVIDDEQLITQFKGFAIHMADAALEGIDTAGGGLWYEYDSAHGGLVKEKHWWVQAEAMVGYLSAWQLTGEWKYAAISLKLWAYVQANIIDSERGEWVWGVYADGSLMAHEDKIGIWKCPYHNSRTCIEVYKRVLKQHIPA